MDIEQLTREGWRRHTDDPEGVLAEVTDAVGDVTDPRDLVRLAGLGVHVAGEHLGRWNDGLALLDSLRASPHCVADSDERAALWRSSAALLLCSGDAAGLEQAAAKGSSGNTPASDRICILATASSALAGVGRVDEAGRWLREAIELASYGPDQSDPAARALAITGNNLAVSFEDKPNRTADEDALLELAATTARTFWEVAGTWQNVKVAEYRLAHTYLALGRPDEAQVHADLALALWRDNDGGAGDGFFVYECLAKVARARGLLDLATRHRDAAAAKLHEIDDAGFAAACRESLEKLDTLLA